MIYPVYLNPTIDKTVYLENLCVGGTNRVKKQLSQGGGKAVNLSIVLSRLLQPVTIAGILYKDHSQLIKTTLAGIPDAVLEFEGVPRVNTKIFDESAGTVTEINESGPPLNARMLGEFEDYFLPLLTEDDLVVLTGSLNGPADYYASLMQKLPCPAVVDAEGESLRHAVKQKPLLIKPNLRELEMLAGRNLAGEREILDVCLALSAGGVHICAVSMGSQGALITDGERAFRAFPLSIKTDSTVGAGDSMLAGIVAALADDAEIDTALLMGSAAAAASITLPGTSLATRELIYEMLPRIAIEKIK